MTRNSRKDLKTEQEESIPLHITLEALREIEAALGVDSLAELARVLVRPKAAYLITVLEILARAASAPDSDRRVRTAAISIDAALASISTAIDDMGRAKTAFEEISLEPSETVALPQKSSRINAA